MLSSNFDENDDQQQMDVENRECTTLLFPTVGGFGGVLSSVSVFVHL